MKKFLKWGGGIAALCLLCCAAPLTALFVGGGALIGTSFFEQGEKYGLMALGAGTMAAAALSIWWRQRKQAACEVPKR